MPTRVILSAILASQTMGNQQVFLRTLADLAESDLRPLYSKHYPGETGLRTGAEYIKVSYVSPNSPASHRRLSSAVILPTKIQPRGLVLFYHGTSVTDAKVPSRMSDEAMLTMLPFLARGFAVAMPDYIGQGDSPGRHPYPLGSINAWSGIDLVPVAQKLAEERGFPTGQDVFVSGYSEGGAVAMWGARHAQERPDRAKVKFRAAAPLSGPYDLSQTTAQSMISDQSNPIWRAIRVFLVGYIGYSAEQWVPGTKLSDLFVPSFASYVPLAFQTSKTDEEITERLVKKWIQIRPGARSIRPIIQPKFLAALSKGDKRNPVVKVLAENDSYDWSPALPMLMVALDQDYVVSPENTRKAISVMRMRGVPESRVRAIFLPDDLNHITGMPKCASLAADFFLRESSSK